MTRKEFIESAVKLGYCDRSQASAYCKGKPKDDYTEEDYRALSSLANTCYFRDRGVSLTRLGYRELSNGAYSSKMYTNVADDQWHAKGK